MEDIKFVLENVDREDTADHMCDLLYDEGNSSWKMFEELAYSYMNGNDDFRKGMDVACSILTGWYLTTIAEQIKEKYEEREAED